jgi:CSLREA domain-containing protein
MLRNCWLKWFENRMQYRRLTGRSLGRRRRTSRYRPTAAFIGEALETRTLLTTYFVTTTADVVNANDGQTSLREAITMAQADTTADIIRFAAGLEGAVFSITQGPLPTITEDLQILGTVGNAQSINGAGLVVNASGAGDVTTFAMNSVNINLTPSGAGLQVNATADGIANVTVFNSRLTNAAAQGVNFVAHTGGVLNLTLANVQVLSNGDIVQSEGIKGAIGVGTQAQSLTTPGNFATANLRFSTLTVANQFLEAFRLDVETGGIVTTPTAITNANFSGNGFGNQRSGVRFQVSGAGSRLQADFSGTAAHNVTGTGYDFRALSGSTLDVSIAGGASQNAKADALNFMVDDATAIVDVNGFTALTNGDNGVEGRFTNGADVTFNTFNNVSINGAGRTGLKIGVLSGSTLNAFNATNVTANGSGAAGINSDGSGALLTTLDSVSTFNFTNLTTNNNLVRGVEVGVNAAGTSTKTFNNLVATGNALAHPIGIGVGNNSTLNTTINGGNLTSAGAVVGSNIVYMPVTVGSTSNLTIDGVTMNGSTSSGIVALYDNSQGVVNVRNSTSTGNRAVGIALFAKNGADVDANFENVNVSGAGQTTPSNGMRLEIDGPGSTGDFTFDGVNADGAAGTGISLVYNNLAIGSVNQFDNVSAQNTRGDGVRVLVNGIGTTLTNFVANGVNVTGAGLGTNQNSDGLDITVAGPGAIGNFDIQDVTANNAAGRGIKLQVENTATATVNVDDFAADGNGLEGVAVDVGTVVAGAQLLGSAFTNGSASGNGQAFMASRAGIRANVRGTNSVADLDFGSVFVNSNTDDGLSLTGEAGATMDVDLAGGITAVGNLANGVDFRGGGPATTVSLAASGAGNIYTGNGGIGLNVLLSNQVTANAINIQGTASLNQSDGIRVADDGSGVTINSLQVSGNSQMNTNLGNGLAISLDGAMGLTSLDLSALTLSDNVGDQINVYLANMSLTDILLDDITATGTGAGGGGGDGIELTLDSTAVTNSLALDGITATNNGEDGLELRFLNGASIPVSSAIDVGTFNDNGQHGVNLDVNSSVIALSLTNSTAAMQNTVSSLSRNGMHGLNVTLNSATLTMDDVDRQTINANGGAGINILGATPSDFTSGNSFTNNTINNNGSFGFRGVFNGGQFDIAIGEAGAGNVFDNNTGAGIAIDQIQNSMGQLSIEDNQITDTNDGGAVFNGDGIFIRQLGTVSPIQATNRLTRVGGPGLLIQNNRIGVTNAGAADSNAGNGIIFQSEEQSDIDGLHVFDNLVSNNAADGLNLVRFDQVDITDFQVRRNEFNNNQSDGLELLGQNDTTDLLVATITDNEFMNNANNGLSFQVNADARIQPNLNNNMIVQNGVDGIQTREVILDISDERQLSGSWTNNTIADNTRNGIRIGGATSGLSVSNNHIGATFNQFGQVVIDGNGSTGILINGAGSSSWTENNIIRNGRMVQADRSQGHGVDVQGAGFKSTTLTRNIIRQNFQDGVEFNNNGGGNLSFTLTLNDNRIQQNVGRGLDVLNQGNTFTAVNIFSSSNNRANNQFSSNGEEGIYVVNTSSTSQNQTDFSGATLAQDGNINTSPRLQLSLDDATISNNGSEGNNGQMVASAGLLIRVGSAEASAVTATPNTFVSDFATDGTSTVVQNGGVSAQLLDSTLRGNFGDDVFIHGYTSTVDPATLTGTWSATEFTINNPGNGDPLSRLDLVWGLSDFDSVDVNNSTRRGTPGGEAGAYYNNAEGTFKSRTGNSTPGSPFNNSGTRRRNAQRVPARTLTDGSVLAPGNAPADGGRFVYPGMGDSTFRVRSTNGASLAPFGQTSFSPGTVAGELPFIWGGFGPTSQMNSNAGPYSEVPGTPVPVASGSVQFSDPELDMLNNYDNSQIVVRRRTGANAQDVLAFQDGNGLTRVGNTIVKNGAVIATFNTVSVAGQLTVTFTDANGEIPTSVDAENVLRQITYSNSSMVPPMSVELGVIFNDGGVLQPIAQQTFSSVMINIIPFNSTPQIVNLGPANVFTTGGAPVAIENNNDADIIDAELDELNNYNTAVLTVARNGGPSADDTYGFVNTGGLTLNGTNIQKGGQTIATFMQAGGTLTITFTDANAIPTSLDADNVLRGITYDNTNAAPPAMVTLRVTLNDSNVGGGGSQQGFTTVTVPII